MNPEPSKRPEEQDDEEALAAVLEGHWRALNRGQATGGEAEVLLNNPQARSADVLSCLHVIEAIHEAAGMIAEDSQMDATSDLNSSTHTDRGQAPISRPNIEVGDTARGFEIREVLGQGGQAISYKAWDPRLRRHVVLKLYHSAASRRQREVILSEGQKLARVRSPYVPECYAVEDIDDVPCLFLEYIPGSNLADLHRSKPLPMREALVLTAQIATALHSVHTAGLVHCNVKPSNILIADDGSPRLVNFGLAKSLGDPELRRPSGTFTYMAPEQARGELERVGPRTDVFSLGATLYFLLTGSSPYAGTTRKEVWRAACEGDIKPARQVNKKLPRTVNDLCMRALAKAPESRFDSAAQLADTIRRYLNRHVMQRAVAVAGILLIIVAGVIIYANRGGNKQTGPDKVVEPLQIVSVRINQLLQKKPGEHERNGFVVKDDDVLMDAYRLRLGDGVQFRASLSRPAYAYWIAFRPDGVEEICFPPSLDADKPPPLTDTPEYPLEDKSGVVYGLTDGLGIQVFALVVSDEPLPSYNEWRKEMPPSPWKASTLDKTPVLRRHDGQWLEVFPLGRRDQTRGAGQKTVVPDSQCEELVTWLRNDKRIRAIEIWALPVRPRD